VGDRAEKQTRAWKLNFQNNVLLPFSVGVNDWFSTGLKGVVGSLPSVEMSWSENDAAYTVFSLWEGLSSI